MVDKECRQEVFKNLDKANNILGNWILSLKAIPDSEIPNITSITDAITDINKNINSDELLTLYALKLYTEHHVSWEKAGSISGKHIFGLREYCNSKNVDWTNLRIDEYYGLTDPNIIKEEWKKLDPQGLVAPVQYNLESNVTFKSDSEYSKKQLLQEHYTATARYTLTEFIIIYHDTIRIFNKDYSEFKESVNYLRKTSKRLNVLNQEDLDKWISTLQDAYALLRKAIENEDIYYFNEAFKLVEDNLQEDAYETSIKKMSRVN